ncbi:hypothetical protein BDV93DRAFT_555920 [Ceratobasidium sp. AG-I]|nr:hypothetical protein BDV93DRAFT_555920 [Ceratobasidium sp. AG-I]
MPKTPQAPITTSSIRGPTGALHLFNLSQCDSPRDSLASHPVANLAKIPARGTRDEPSAPIIVGYAAHAQVPAQRTTQQIEELGRRATREVLKNMVYKPNSRDTATRNGKAIVGGHVTASPSPPHHIPRTSPIIPAASRRQNTDNNSDWNTCRPPAPTHTSPQQRETPQEKPQPG